MSVELKDDFSRWFIGKDLTSDWTSGNFDKWAEILSPLRDAKINILEIGSWEGRSAIFWLEFFPHSQLTCIDNFEGSPTCPTIIEAREQIPNIENRFDANMKIYGPRVTKIRSRSASALDALAYKEASFDLIYIDAEHRRDDVLIDSLLAVKMIRENGIVIWDDYDWRPEFSDENRPKQAIDVFLQLHREFEIIHTGYQLIARKIPYPKSQ